MQAKSEFLSQLQLQSRLAFQRTGVVLQGDATWQDELISFFYQTHKPTQQEQWFCVGNWRMDDVLCVNSKQGNILLGRECDVLLFDARDEFDANSFTASLGALVGGGLLIVVTRDQETTNQAQRWMQIQWQKLVVIEQNHPLPKLPPFTQTQREPQYAEQTHAVSLVENVVNGHRKRPLVLTADRGRGKSSALGIACARLLQQKPLRILLTAPSIKAVEPVYQHALRLLESAQRIKKDRLEIGLGYIQFVAPDDLLSSLPDCDLLLVDEAAAIPVPLLKQITAHYHRLVFSSTIHGYEGCGRGFSLKFVDWLNAHRPGMKTYHLQQPIRWSENDKLESWLYQAFLLNAELADIDAVKNDDILLSKVSKSELVSNPSVLDACFALLVNAHYQTSPNDLIHLLQDESCEVHIAIKQEHIIGVVLTVEEGNLDDELIRDVQLGKRRPKGHLAPITIVNQLGYPQVGKLSTQRIMRIAVHPKLQGNGIGQYILKQFEQSLAPHISYLSTSFGATEELIHFWQKSGYQAIRLGTMRDAASGCYSLLMVRPCGPSAQPWIQQAEMLYKELLSVATSQVYPKLEPALFRALFSHPFGGIRLHPIKLNLIACYTQGGNSYESVSVWVQQWLLLNGLDAVSDFVIAKVFFAQDWSECAKQFGYSGRKQAEQKLRQELKILLSKFTV
ncbi:tRNA(Met) cytidine acetyltransferase TmcA [Vibrio alfacsensis]|uniref:tRNA(Met) cytidine acetyltransferase TmcA n=1 Tax=Vibrio alfacsensis TaxID=1074311 RepID=UPI0040677B13